MGWDWNDLRHFLAVARVGTTLGAARELGTNQTTVARRISALEKSLDSTLFVRTASGYALTEVGSALVPFAEQVEASAARFGEEAAERTRAARSVIRLTTSDILADIVATPAIMSFKALRPDIHVMLDVDRRFLDLAGGEADIALRAIPGHEDPRLVVRKVIDDGWAVYCGNAYLSPPVNIMDALSHPFATLTGRAQEVLLKAPVKIDIRYSTNNMPALMDAIAGGDCIGGLPRLAGGRDRRLRRCFDVPIEPGGIWIVYPERLRSAPHIRALVDHLAGFIADWHRTEAMP